MEVRLIPEPIVRSLISPQEALEAVRAAFIQLAHGDAVLPDPSELDLAERRGDMHVKGAWLKRAPFFSFKAASGFYDNPSRGLPTNAGLVLVFDSATGFIRAVLFDNGYLTDLRTGAAGALSADLLARPEAQVAAVLGAGVQARRQIEALAGVRQIREVRVWARRAEAAAACAADLATLGVETRPIGAVRDAVAGADVVVTTTPSRAPILEAAWLSPGVHVTAVGADLPDKQELEPAVLGRADRVVVDSLPQCLRSGELHHAVEAGVLRPADVHAELGAVASGLAQGRERGDEITVADLTGLGIQDAAVANLVTERALVTGAGRAVEV